MPITAFDLIEDRGFPVTTNMDSLLLDVLALMQRFNYSQLPIVSVENKPEGIVTAEGILRTQKNLGAPLNKLKVEHAASSAVQTAPEDNIFDVFELFSKHSAVLVVDSENILIGIITPWDAATHLQQRAEDLMLIEDIESAVKEHIEASFTDPSSGILSQEMLDVAVLNMVDHTERITRDISGSLKKYLAMVDVQHSPEPELLREAFSRVINQNRQNKSFDDLTLNQYIELLLHREHWDLYGNIFSLDAEYLRTLLTNVRDIRNQLAHFRDDISEDQREILRYCRDFFERHPVPEFTLSKMDIDDNDTDNISLDVETVGDELQPGESRYARLALYLQQLPIKQQKCILTFEEIGQILEHELPPSAWEHRSWWANDSVGHVQSKQWLDAGWRVASVNLTDKRVILSRNKERELAYIIFFSSLINDLKQYASFDVHDVSPSGTNWATIKAIPRNDRKIAWLNFAFSRRNQIRAELYIDSGDEERNNRIFDKLLGQKDSIEATFGDELNWERLLPKRACRIAAYHDGFITDTDEQLAAIRIWAVDAMIRLEKAIADKAEAAIETI